LYPPEGKKIPIFDVDADPNKVPDLAKSCGSEFTTLQVAKIQYKNK
jgi:hypothetical protein